MNIAGTHYNLNHKALEIYLSGCDGLCKGCHNSELWDYYAGEELIPYSKKEKGLLNKINNPMVGRVWIMGGEPLLQDYERLADLLYIIRAETLKECWLWTRFREVPEIISFWIDYAKIGEYIEDSESYIEPLFGVELASKNQKIIKI